MHDFDLKETFANVKVQVQEEAMKAQLKAFGIGVVLSGAISLPVGAQEVPSPYKEVWSR